MGRPSHESLQLFLLLKTANAHLAAAALAVLLTASCRSLPLEPRPSRIADARASVEARLQAPITLSEVQVTSDADSVYFGFSSHGVAAMQITLNLDYPKDDDGWAIAYLSGDPRSSVVTIGDRTRIAVPWRIFLRGRRDVFLWEVVAWGPYASEGYAFRQGVYPRTQGGREPVGLHWRTEWRTGSRRAQRRTPSHEEVGVIRALMSVAVLGSHLYGRHK